MTSAQTVSDQQSNISRDYRILPPMRRLVKPAGRFWPDMLANQNTHVPQGYREYGGLEVTSRWMGPDRRFTEASVVGGLHWEQRVLVLGLRGSE